MVASERAAEQRRPQKQDEEEIFSFSFLFFFREGEKQGEGRIERKRAGSRGRNRAGGRGEIPGFARGRLIRPRNRAKALADRAVDGYLYKGEKRSRSRPSECFARLRRPGCVALGWGGGVLWPTSQALPRAPYHTCSAYAFLTWCSRWQLACG